MSVVKLRCADGGNAFKAISFASAALPWRSGIMVYVHDDALRGVCNSAAAADCVIDGLHNIHQAYVSNNFVTYTRCGLASGVRGGVQRCCWCNASSYIC